MIPVSVAGAESVSQTTTTVSSPSDAGSKPHSSIGSLSCTSAGNCVGGASYIDSSGHHQAMVAVETNGTWGQATKVSSPSGAATDPLAELIGVYCSSVGNCEAVGNYTDSSGYQQAMQAVETNGTWGQATPLSAPADAATNPQAAPQNLSCVSAGNCEVVGNYTDSSGNERAMQATETDGAWAQATPVSAPDGAAGNPQAVLWDVSCTSAGNCVGVGEYRDSLKRLRPMRAVETGGTWGQATTVSSLPADADPNDLNSDLYSVHCTSAGNCVEVGWYFDSSGTQAMQATETDGVWGQATEISTPSGGHTAHLAYVSCSSAGNCVVVGWYTDSSGTHPMQASETDGAWGPLTRVPDPSDAGSTTGVLIYVACPSAGNCVAAGYYNNSSSDYAMATVTLPDTTAPTTTIALDPASPNGSNSWYVGQVGVTMSASDPGDDSVTATRCVVDPTSVPASFDDLPSGACSLNSVSGDGQHTIYAASEDANGNKETPVSVSFQIDQTPPAVSCPSPAPVFLLGGTGTVTASVTDGTSNPVQTSVSAAADTTTGGVKTVSLTGEDYAGNTTTVSCSYTVLYSAPLTSKIQAMDGDLKVPQGSTMLVGYEFTTPGPHAAANIGFTGAMVTFNVTCTAGQPSSSTFTVPITDPNSPYSDPLNSTAWYPSGNASDPSTYQGSGTVPKCKDAGGNVIQGALVRFKQGGKFSTTVTSDIQVPKVNIRWHYKPDGGKAGDWSGTYSVTPS